MTGRERIDIRIDMQRAEAARRRFEALERFEYVDRVPVSMGFEAQFYLAERGVSWEEYFSDPVTQMRHQLLNRKLLYEMAPDDRPFDGTITLNPDFQNVVNSSAVGCEIEWLADDPPRARPFLRDEVDLQKLQKPPPDAGLWGKSLQWYYAMMEARDRFDVRVNGEPVPVNIHVGVTGDTPYIMMVDAAQQNLFVWMMECPELLLEAMSKLTHGLIEAEHAFRRLRGVDLDYGFWLSDDPVPMLSNDQYREHVAPHTLALYEALSRPGAPRGMHLCGRNTHVIPTLMDYLHITSLDGAGYVNRPEDYVGTLAGKVVFRGNLDPMLLLNGPVSDIKRAAHHVMSVLAPHGGLHLQDGYNICPHTPWEHIRAVVEAADEYGLPHSERHS
ncbi:MAG: hypothetical protein HRF45_08680 [Fimbriimonadia bacterium]